MDGAQASTTNIVRWLFVADPKPLSRTSELKRSRARTYLYESLYRCITKHDLNEAFVLLKVLPKETNFDSYALLRFILILIESNQTQRINKNVIIYLEALLSKLDISKPDAFVEFLTYFIKNNRIDDAKELFDERHRYIMSKFHRPLPYVDVNVRCYEFYLNYLTWNERLDSMEAKPKFDVSIQGWIVNAIDCLRTTTSNHEFFVICLLRVLLYYGYYRKAYLFMSEFQRNNPNNLGAQLMHYNLLKRLEAMSMAYKADQQSDDQQDVPMPDELSWERRLEKRSADLQSINNFSSSVEERFEPDIYPLEEDQLRIIKNLRLLDPAGQELMEMTRSKTVDVDTLKDLLDGLEVIREISNVQRWRNIRDIIELMMDSEEEAMCNEARYLWQKRYRQYWLSVDMISMIGSQVSKRERKFVKQTYDLLVSFLGQQIG